jgi:hypothetical protein
MHKIYLGFITLLLGATSFAQQRVDISKSDVNVSSFFHVAGGEAFTTAKFIKLVEGTPYFRDEWYEGVVVLADNQEFRNLQVKLDIFDNELHYKDEKGSERIATMPVKEVVLTDTNGVNYRFINARFLPPTEARPRDGWYQWLHSGKVQLYKYYTKQVSESKPYGSATVEERMYTSEQYLVYYNKTLVPVKKLKDAPSVFGDKKSELTAFLGDKDKQGLTPDNLMITLVCYYESLLSTGK